MDAYLILQSNHGIMVEEEEEDSLGSVSSSSSSLVSSGGGGGGGSSDLMDDATSTSTSSSSRPTTSSNPEEGPLYEMSSLKTQLPIKKGLSKHYQGKSQSFASLSSVRCLEDMVKQERVPCIRIKKLKSSKSYGGGLDTHKSLSPRTCSRAIAKKPSRGCLQLASSINNNSTRKHHGFFLSKPPVPNSQRPSHFSSQTLLFA